jgi:hypothetical protein
MIAVGGLQEWEAVGERRAASGLATRQWPHASQAAGNLVAFEGGDCAGFASPVAVRIQARRGT